MKIALLIIASIIFTELILQGACLLYPTFDSIIFAYKAPVESIVIKDDVLRHKGDPKHIDHDPRGYRNETALEVSDVVMLGDSHTYGTSVAISEAWPNLIGKHSKLKTYNMGFGGYGPAHYLLQLDDVIKLSPKLVIVGVYFGDDFYGSLQLALSSERLSSFLTNYELDTIKKLEKKSKFQKEVSYLFNICNLDPGLRGVLSQNSALYGVFRAVVKEMQKKDSPKPTILSNDSGKSKTALTKEQLKYCSFVNAKDGWRTILTSAYRRLHNDRKDPRINIGFDLTLRILLDINNRVTSSGAELLVVLLPTKESVFSRKILNPETHIGYSELISNEQVNRDKLKQFLDGNRIPFIDFLPYLQKSKRQPYHSNADGHLNELGHEIIADAVIKRISDFK